MGRAEFWRVSSDGEELRRSRPARFAGEFILGVTKPNDLNTGVPSEWEAIAQANVVNEDVVITTGGTLGNPYVYEGHTVNGRIFIEASYVRVANNFVHGSPTPDPGPDTALIVCSDAGLVGIEIERNTLDNQAASVYLNGIRGHHFKATRNRIKNVLDGYDVFISSGSTTDHLGVEIYGDYVSDLTYMSPDPNHPDNRSHNDCLQIPGNGGVTVVGARFEATVSTTLGSGYNGLAAPVESNPYDPSVTGQAIGLTSNVSAILNPVVIDKCWLGYGAQSITWIDGGKGGVTGVAHQITNNLFVRGGNPLISKDGVSARRPVLIAPDIDVPNLPLTENAVGDLDKAIEDGGSNNRWDDDLSFITVTRRAS